MAPTRYLLSVYHDFGQAASAEEIRRTYPAVDSFNTKLLEQGALVFGGGLCPPETATVVRTSQGQITTTDGPFAESREHLGGFWVIDAADLDQALEWSRQAALACAAPVEVRPFEPDV